MLLVEQGGVYVGFGRCGGGVKSMIVDAFFLLLALWDVLENHALSWACLYMFILIIYTVYTVCVYIYIHIERYF